MVGFAHVMARCPDMSEFDCLTLAIGNMLAVLHGEVYNITCSGWNRRRKKGCIAPGLDIVRLNGVDSNYR